MGNNKDKLAKDWKEIVAQVYYEHPDWKAPQVRRQVAVHLGENKTPGLSAIQKEWAYCRNNDEEKIKILEAGLEKPWQLGALKDYPLSPEVVPDILAVEQWGETTPDIFGEPRKPLTVRQALWISRLHGVANLLHAGAKNKKQKLGLLAWLWKWSEAYAQREIICKLMGMSYVDTSKLDKAMWKGSTPVVATVKGEKTSSVFLFSRDRKVSR